jgi:hypothetical protein
MGTVVVEDAGTVEGLSMRVTRVSVNGEPKIRLQFKVTDWAGNDWMKSLQKRIDSGETGLEVTTTGMEVRKWEILPDGSVVLHPDGTHPHSGTSDGEIITIDASRKGQTYQGEIPGGGIFNFHRANKTGNTPDYFKSGNDSNPNVSFHNRVELELPADATAADIQDALDSLNVPDAVFRPATEQDIRTYKENRMIAMLGGKKDPSKNLSGEMREATLNQIKDKWGVTADDVEFISNPADGGRIQMLLPREVGEKIAEATGVKRFEHYWKLGKYSDSMTDSEKAAEIVRLLTDPNFSMLSTTERWTNGINVAGQSSYMDIGAVGGDYLFSTPKTSEFNPAQSPDYGEVFRISLDAAEVLRRMDWYANKHDSFGQLQEEQDYIDYLAGYLAGGGSVYEVLFKHSIHIPSYIIGAEVGTAYKAEVLQRLKDAGITEIHGIPLNDFFKGGA